MTLKTITSSEVLIKSQKIKSLNLKKEKALFVKKVKLCSCLSIGFVGIYFFLNQRDSSEIKEDAFVQIKLDCLREARDKYSIKSLVKKSLLAFFIIPIIGKAFSSTEELIKKKLFCKLLDDEKNLMTEHQEIIKTAIILKEFLKLIESNIIKEDEDFLLLLNQLRQYLVLASARHLLLSRENHKLYLQWALIKKLVFLFNQLASGKEKLELTINNFSQLLKTCEALQNISLDQ
jgi:hypothetical protein